MMIYLIYFVYFFRVNTFVCVIFYHPKQYTAVKNMLEIKYLYLKQKIETEKMKINLNFPAT